MNQPGFPVSQSNLSQLEKKLDQRLSEKVYPVSSASISAFTDQEAYDKLFTGPALGVIILPGGTFTRVAPAYASVLA